MVGEISIDWIDIGYVLVVVLLVGVALSAIVGAIAVGPARNVLGTAVGIIEDENVILTDLQGRRLKRPNRSDLNDPDPAVRRRALESYQARARPALDRSASTFYVILKAEAAKIILILFSTVIASSVAFGSFLAFHDFLFHSSGAVRVTPGVSVDPTAVSGLLSVIWEHIRSAFMFDFSEDCAKRGPYVLSGAGTEASSIAYRLVLAWSVPAIVRQAGWTFVVLTGRYYEVTSTLRQIANLNLDDLERVLEPYARSVKGS